MQQKKAQVTIFIIIALFLIAAALFSYLIFIERPSTIPIKLQQVESYFLDCVSEKTKETAGIAGMQGGYIKPPEFEPGSSYKLFSNYYMFLGTEIPYWYYLSGNNIQKEQVPTKEEIEQQISDYLEEQISLCSLDNFEQQGYIIETSPGAIVQTKINDNSIDVTITKEITIEFGDIKTTIIEHKTTARSRLGSLYKEALEIYNYEKESAFLENYALDTLYLNAPVTGLEISCAPKIWFKEQIKQELKNAIQANIGQVKVKGTYYSLANSQNKYFVVDTGKSYNNDVNFLASEPYRIEIWPSEDNIMAADPVGIQQGLNAMGFCYVPYHFVYDIDFPVLIQISKDGEIFQFPVAIVIDKTVPRQAEVGETGKIEADICNYKGSVGTVYTYDNNNNPVEAEISFKCFNQVCPIGITKKSQGKAYISDFFPQCLNGFIIAEALGYAKAKTQVSSNQPFVTSLYLSQLKKFNVIANVASDESAVITFSSDEHSAILFYPTQKEIELTAATYEITAQVFKEKSIILQSGTTEHCIKTPDWLGILHEECYEIDVPQQSLTNVVYGGGFTTIGITPQEIESSSKLNINIPKTTVPSNLQELQEVYSIIAVSELDLDLS
jgi:hypothetical protein